LGGWFAPRTALGLVVRNQLTRLMSAPLIGDRLVRRMFGDRFDLPPPPP
jgi:hypothetical protein